MHFTRRVFAERSVLTLAGAMVCGLLTEPYACAQSSNAANTSAPSFEVASIKRNHSGTGLTRLMVAPDGLSGNDLSVKMLIGFAYNMRDFQISGGTGWIDSDRYDIETKDG